MTKRFVLVKNEVRDLVIEECALELETSYPGHAWLNAACAALRSMKSTPQPARHVGNVGESKT